MAEIRLRHGVYLALAVPPLTGDKLFAGAGLKDRAKSAWASAEIPFPLEALSKIARSPGVARS
jgi:hypothetical protein